ncbi:MAG: phosphoglycerate dehydrogenase [Oscillospiraceae bacterium]|jgi:D-3-phosphoglycerate dehydrogenase|nr:phosphoglycerate dehydrogenase [Oscillospiraceae bacterium]
MYRLQTLNEISDAIYQSLNASFSVRGDEPAPDGILVRSADMHSLALPPSVLAVARAGAGVNNIPLDACSEQGICVFNTPGANANAVCELAVAGMLLCSRDIVGGIQWAQGLKGQADVPKLVEKGKSAFVGPELRGKRLGIIGLGAIGVLVANAAVALGMDVGGYDPAISVEHAWRLSRSVHRATNLDELLATSDYVTLHLPLNDKTRGMMDGQSLGRMKRGAHLLNFARAELVDTVALREALDTGVLRAYVTDFPTEALLDVKGVMPIPHLGASTPESEDNCAAMAAAQLRDYLECGVIRNSVNLPDTELATLTKPRVAVVHRNVPNMLSAIAAAVGDLAINISDMVNKSRAAMAYTVLDLDLSDAVQSLADTIAAIPGVIRVRTLAPKA